MVRELRICGHPEEAYQLVKAFREDVKKTKCQLNTELLAKDRTIKKFQGFCLIRECSEKIFKWNLCEYHYHQKVGYKRRERAKLVRQPKHRTIHAVRVFSDGARRFFASTFVFENGSVDITFRLGS